MREAPLYEVKSDDDSSFNSNKMKAVDEMDEWNRDDEDNLEDQLRKGN